MSKNPISQSFSFKAYFSADSIPQANWLVGEIVAYWGSQLVGMMIKRWRLDSGMRMKQVLALSRSGDNV